MLAGSFLLLLGVLGWRLLHLYSVGRPYDALLPPTRDFLTMALAGDSSGLVRTGASATGEEIFVIFHGTSRGTCLNRPLAVTFAGALPDARIRTISTDCGKRP